MPQFLLSEAKTAIAPIVAKPSGVACEAELFLGPDEATKVTSSGRVPFVSTGAARNVSLPITMPGAPGTYRGYIDVLAGGFRFLAYILKEDVVIAAPVTISFKGDSFVTRWAARLYDTLTGKWQSCGARAVSQSCSFIVSGGPVLLEITWSYEEVGVAWYSTANINLLPNIGGGNYIWRQAYTRSLNGVAVIAGENIPSSQITGTVINVERITNYAGELEVWYTFAIDWSTSGIGQYFVGGSVRGRATSQAPGEILLAGNKYSARLYVRESIGGSVAGRNNVSWCFFYDQCRAPSPYPPEYYNFTGSLTYWPSYPLASVYAKISGTAPRFAIVILERDANNLTTKRQWRLVGPFSDYISVDYGVGFFEMYANPDVSALFDRSTWQLQNWVRVAVITTEQ